MRHRVMTLIAVLSLSLGLGANIEIFSLLNAVLFRTLPVSAPASLVVLSHYGKDGDSDARRRFSNFPLYEFIRANNRSFTDALGFSPTQLRLQRDEATVAIPAQWVSANYFSTLGVRPALGRTLLADDDKNPAIVVVSDRLWRRELAGDLHVIGQSITLNGHAVTVVGVLPPDFTGMIPGAPADLTLLLSAQPLLQPAQGNMATVGLGPKDEPVPSWPWYMVARLKPRTSMAQAEAETSLLFRQWAKHRGASDAYIEASFARGALIPAGRGVSTLSQKFGAPLGVLQAIAAGVFLIACANVANLLLVRGAARRQEIAVRSALGASRGRLIRHILSEGLVLMVLSGLGGLLVGAWGSSLLASLLASGRTLIDLQVPMDWRVLTFAGIASAVGCLATSLLPALQLSRNAPAMTLSEPSDRGTDRTTHRWGQVLVTMQIAVSLCLLVTTGMFVNNLRQITGIGTGYETSHLLSISFDWSAAGYSRTQMIDFVTRASEAVAALPGVEAASATHLEPLGQQQSQRWLTVRDGTGDAPPRVAELNVVSSDYFRTMRLPIEQGRTFDPRDRVDSPKVAMISAALGRLCFGDKDPIGQPLWIARDTKGSPLTIIGVVRDAKQRDLREASLPMLFLPTAQSTAWEMNLLVRTRTESADLSAALRRTIATLARDVPIREITTPQMQMNRTLLQERVLAMLSGFFGPLALIIATIGVYGLLAYQVTCRTKEIGVRAALGASMMDILRLVLGRGLILIASGAALGGGVSLLVGHVLRRFLFAVSPYDPLVFTASVATLALTGLVACLVPAIRASKVDPIVALRHT